MNASFPEFANVQGLIVIGCGIWGKFGACGEGGE
jgi:hypothetical protein